MRISPPFACVLLVLSGLLPLAAQNKPTPTPAKPAAPAKAEPTPIVVVPGKNVLRNGEFESPRTQEDAWDGLDATGFLYGEKDQLPVLSINGDIIDTPMPVSVGVGDLNGDGLPDIAMMDVVGYIHIYFNAGSKTEPKFPNAELAPVFLGRTQKGQTPNPLSSFYVRNGPRLGLADTGGGKLDMFIGNYWGEVFLLRNEGSNTKPDFHQPVDPSKIAIPTAKDSNTRWGNVFSPAVWDWNKDGKVDLLLGEGSYSANNIHLLINSGSSGRPVFEENNRSVLAYGDGLDQLSPAVVDYNGDGNMDLLVAERSGKVALYLNKGGEWKPGVDLPFASFVAGPDGKPMSFGGISTVSTGDLNGDDRFDIVVGKANGRIAVAYNTGSKTEPKFSAPVDLKGESPLPALKLPTGWVADYGLTRGNFLGYATLVSAEDDPEAAPPEGKLALKFAYRPSLNKIMAPPVAQAYSPAFANFDRSKPLLGENTSRSGFVLADAQANMCMVRIFGFPLKPGQNYTLSFKVKGTGVTGAQALLGWEGRKTLSEKVIQGDRNTAKREKVEAYGLDSILIPFNPTPVWAEVKKDFSASYADKRLLEGGLDIMRSSLEITFALQPMVGVFYIDDVKIIPR